MHISLQYRPLNSAVFRVRDQSQRVPFHLTIGRDLVEWASRVSTFSLIPRSEPTVNLPGTTRSYCFGSTSESRPGDSKFCRARRSLGALDNSFDRRAGFLNGFGLITGRANGSAVAACIDQPPEPGAGASPHLKGEASMMSMS